MTTTNETKDRIRALLPCLATAFKDDYKAWNVSMNHTSPACMVYDVSFEEGSKFTKIVKYDGGQRSVLGFVCMVDTESKGRKFYAGDLLKAAGWKAPALNFARGNIFYLDQAVKNKNVRWTGLG